MVKSTFDDDSDSDSFNSDDSDLSDEKGGNTMMSLLSSYYGVDDDEKKEDPSTQTSSNIDKTGFDHTSYVRDLLCTCELNDLTKQDTKLVHDIKTLDSDMQMLVYENYNKFISATETIKRMKTNVDAMDDDMDAVKAKIETITTTTIRLDQTLTSKRTKIDKLVRIKRLLTRLEFLSELPERLEKMIEEEMYTAAIQLYKRTISVLIKQENVLSFKKIKEKTENMMQDLRLKVLSLMDAQTLEAQQLTQYVGILKLMECPKDVVIEKFLAAHKRRSFQMIKEFVAGLDKNKEKGGNAGKDGDDTSSDKDKAIINIASVRQFHQSLVVGLIESSKGVSEMFPANSTTNTNSGSGGMTHATAYDELQGMIGLVIPEYVDAITAALGQFFNVYDMVSRREQRKSNGNNSGINSSSDSTQEEQALVDAPPSTQTLQTLHEERQVWVSLSRQVILDCQYLDSATESVRPVDCDPSLPHADTVASEVLSILDKHFDELFVGHLQVW